MATLENAELGVKFDLPDSISLGQDLQFTGLLTDAGHDMGKAFLGCFALITNWACPDLPVAGEVENLPSTTRRKQIVNWVVSETINYATAKTDIPKD